MDERVILYKNCVRIVLELCYCYVIGKIIQFESVSFEKFFRAGQLYCILSWGVYHCYAVDNTWQWSDPHHTNRMRRCVYIKRKWTKLNWDGNILYFTTLLRAQELYMLWTNKYEGMVEKVTLVYHNLLRYGCAAHWGRVHIDKLLNFACVPRAAIYRMTHRRWLTEGDSPSKESLRLYLTGRNKGQQNRLQPTHCKWPQVENLQKPSFRRRNGTN